MYHLTLHDIKNEGSAVHVLGPVVLMADKKSADRRAVCQSVKVVSVYPITINCRVRELRNTGLFIII